jgi:hypothetical protein
MKLALILVLTAVSAASVGCVIGWLLRREDRNDNNGFD